MRGVDYGAWEWLVRYADVCGSALADFFDGKHNIVLGGSWATHPRVAGRKTL